MRKLVNAGELRHYVAIQEKLETQDANGILTWTWQTVNDERGDWSAIPMAKLPVSAREFEAAAAVQGEQATRFVMRWMPGVNSKMRVLHDDKAYDIRGVMEDQDSGSEYITLSCTQGVNDG